MLILSRKVGQKIVVPECDLVFTVLEIRGDKVRLGIAAPEELAVHRQEIWERIQAEQAAEQQGSAIPEIVGHCG